MAEAETTGDDGLITVERLIEMFESSEESTDEARRLAERDRDYHDNKQLSPEELTELKKRGQPPYIDNRIKSKVDYLVGLEKQQRVNPRAWPRTPMHEDDADSVSESLNYVADRENFDYKRSQIWKNLLVEGAGGFAISIEQGYRDEINVVLRRIPWDRMFWDPASSEPDFSDAGYLGTVQWMDYDDAAALYPDAVDKLTSTIDTAQVADTYDDKPKYSVWADKKRRRVRIVQIWLKRNEQWYFAEFTKGGILKAGPSPYVNDQGESDCELRFQSAYADRDNNRYGLVRELILLQDAINKRNSKALHLLNTAQVVSRKGAVDDKEKGRREAARPDGWIEINDIGDDINKAFQFNTRSDLAQGQFLLLQEAKNSIDLKGPNATAMGDKAQGSAAASGKAILASQQGGMIALGDLLDNLRRLDIEVFRAIWYRIRQFWTAEKWVRVTDDENNVRWVGFNVDPSRVMMASPEQQQMIAGVVKNVAELDCDIIISDAPDSVAPSIEQFEALVQLKQLDTENEIPFELILKAAPNLRDKSDYLKMIRERREAAQNNPQAQAMQQLQFAGAKAEVDEINSKVALNMAKAQEAGRPEMQSPQAPEVPIELQSMKTMAEIDKIEADTQKSYADAFKTEQEGRLAPMKARQEAIDRQADRQSREQQFRQKASQAA